MYAEKAYQDKLKAELAPHFGASLRVTVRVGSTSGKTVAAAQVARAGEAPGARHAKPSRAIRSFADLVQDLGAEVVPSSIRPPEARQLNQAKR